MNFRRHRVKNRPHTLRQALRENTIIAAIVALMFQAISIDATPEQEAFTTGAVWVTLGTAAIHLLTALYLIRRGIRTRADLIVLRYGAVQILAALVVYTLAASCSAGRVL